MKILIVILAVLALGSIVLGFLLDIPYSQKMIGFGVVGLFLIVFPLFSWYRWKDKDMRDYMLTKENLEKMRKYKDDDRR
ncbi:MAG TPA: hypothetical protein PKL92_05175 [Aquaticitalea sp.]|nr:hypothetical protein [Aquaticitalea sp.]HNU60539.1 hypothetical protein [Aquaticitalea sp.]